MTERKRGDLRRQQSMERRAYELAASGNHIDYLTIEPVLLSEGHVDAQEWLSRDSVRGDLKALCDMARRLGSTATGRASD